MEDEKMSFIHDIENWKEVSELIPKLQNAVIQNLQKHLNNQNDVVEVSRSDLLERHKERDQWPDKRSNLRLLFILVHA